jgi:heptaprenyl diphosphate synthase
MEYPIQKYAMNKVKKLILISLLVSQAMVLSFIESMIPLNFSVPGAKLGLANIVTLTSLYLFSFKETLLIIVLRTVMTAFISGSFSMFLYSISGALLSFLVMYLLIHTIPEKVSTIGVSIVGAIFHNLGQLAMAALVIQNIKIVLYLPFLMVAGIATGCIVGASVKYLMKYLKKIKYFNL